MPNIELSNADYTALLKSLKFLGSMIHDEMDDISVMDKDDQENFDDLRAEYDEATRLWELIREQAPTFVVQYRVSRECGGQEEGGWWYDWHDEPKLVAVCPNEDDALRLVRLLTEQEKSWKKEAGERDRFSVIGTPDTLFVMEQVVGEHETKNRPHYE